jgi:outer membrane protein
LKPSTFNFQFAIALALLLTHPALAQEPRRLSLHEAHETALHNHPLISVADLKTLAAQQVMREARSAFFPNISGNVVAVGTTADNTRLAAVAGLNNPAIFDRNAEGLMISQLITDFGRTANLTGSAKLQAEAAANNAKATREQILLAVDGAFFSALQAQSVTRVAQQTVTARQTFLDQVTALASNKLRSELDVSFARVNVEDARLLLSKAQNDLDAAFSQLSTLLGGRKQMTYELVDEPLPLGLSTNADQLVEEGLRARPDLIALRQSGEASHRFAKAERASRYPTIAAVGAAGVSPIHDPQIPDSYAAAGVTLNLPLFAGGLYSARQKEAELRAQAEQERVRDAENNVVRDVRIAWLNARNAYDRLGITAQLVKNATLSYDLARARYKNGVSSIVELNQAELNKISAEISYADTKYEYLLRRSALDFQTGVLK